MKNYSFLGVFRAYITYHQTTTNEFDKRDPVTIQGYNNKLFRVSQFLSSKNLTRIKPEQFKVSLAQEYLEELSAEYSHNYAARCVDICATAIDFGVNKELCKFNPLASFVIPKKKPKPPAYFTPDQIGKWEKYTSPLDHRQKAAHLFVLIMHTGFDYSDLQEVGRSNILFHKGKKYIVKIRHKGRNRNPAQAIIPLSEMAEQILEMYDYKMKLLPNPRLNEYIKEVADELGMNQHLKVKDGRKIFMMDYLNNKGFSIEATSKIGGHKSIKTTEQTYAHVNLNLVHAELTLKSA